MSNFQREKRIVLDYYSEIERANASTISKVISGPTTSDYEWYGVHPFNEQVGAEAVGRRFWCPFLDAFSHVQRRQDIFFAGDNELDDSVWVMSMGHLMGLFDQPWLGIPPSRKIAMLRYAEFNCVVDGKISKTCFHCDIIGEMHQVGIHPLPLQTGASFVYPGPRTHDGLLYDEQPPEDGAITRELVNRMINELTELNSAENQRVPPEFLARSWNNDMIWYGPAGIGASYTISRYQEQHQYPFREGLKNKVFRGHVARIAEANYAAFFGWPNLTNTPVGGFLGLPGNEIRADMRVVDVYRREGDKLAENWVFIDLPYWLKQQGIDVLQRTASILRADSAPSG